MNSVIKKIHVYLVGTETWCEDCYKKINLDPSRPVAGEQVTDTMDTPKYHYCDKCKKPIKGLRQSKRKKDVKSQ